MSPTNAINWDSLRDPLLHLVDNSYSLRVGGGVEAIFIIREKPWSSKDTP
jgi:hypothetical protein